MKNIIFLLSIASTSVVYAKEVVHFDCGGTEPNWSLSIGEKELTYTSPSLELSHVPVTAIKRTGKAVLIKAKLAHGQSLELVLEQDLKCVSDGVGEPGKETHKIRFTMEKEAYLGCCREKK